MSKSNEIGKPGAPGDDGRQQAIREYAELRYGLFVHYGLYSILARGEWVMNREAIPPQEYRKLKDRFTADAFDAEAICDLAVRSGMRYVVLTTMHHDGFRLYDTALSDFNSMRSPAHRDLVREMVTAAKRRGLKIALYHSLNNWMDQPDAVAALENPKAYETFIEKTFERVRELVTLFNPIDVLWYDGWWPFNAEGWRAEAMNEMVRSIQPHILFNNRNGLDGDMATPEQHVTAPSPWRPWEACITLNDSWGFHTWDSNWKTPRHVLDMLIRVATQRGNLLLNIGPHGDGSIPEPSVRVLDEVGRWLKLHGECIYDMELFTMNLQERGDTRGDWVGQGTFTARGNELYLLAQRWVSSELIFCGLEQRVKSVCLLHDPSKKLDFTQDGPKITVRGLPVQPPDTLCPVFRFSCEAPPSLYWTGGMRVPTVPHPHYDPCPSDMRV